MSDGAITREGARRIMTNRCRSLALFLTLPLYLSFMSSQLFPLKFHSFALVCLTIIFHLSPAVPPLSRLFPSPFSSLSLSISLWPPTAVRYKVLANAPWSGGALVPFPLLNSMHQSRRCLSTDGGRPLNALQMQPETIYQRTGDVNAGPEPGFMHLQSTPSL